MTKKKLKRVCFNAYSCVLASAIFFCPLFCVAFDRVFKMSSVSCWPYVTYLPCLKFGQVLLYPNIIAMESTLVSMEVANASLNNKIFPLYQLSSCWLISQQPTNDSNDSLDLILLIRAFCAFKTKRLTEKKILADTGYARYWICVSQKAIENRVWLQCDPDWVDYLDSKQNSTKCMHFAGNILLRQWWQWHM